MAKAVTKAVGPRYDVHPGVAMVQKWVAGLKESTGRSLEEWIKVVRRDGPAEEKARRAWLTSEHGLGTNGASWIAARAGEGWRGGENDDPGAYLTAAAGYVEAMYSGKRSGLRPVHDRLVVLARGLGKDVRVCPCRTMVPLYRAHVFAQVKPGSNSRVDLGLALAKAKGRLSGRLIDTGGKAKGDRITHRIAISEVGEIDAEVERWLGAAYGLDG